MERKQRRQTKVKEIVQTLDIDEFHRLTDLLFELLKENNSACARLLGISRITWKKWEKEPPTWPWWNMILRTIITHYLTALQSRRGLTGKHRTRVMNALSQIQKPEEMMSQVENEAYQINGAETHLYKLLGGKGMFWNEIRKPGNCGGFDVRSLKSAARKMGIIKSQEGYGEHKKSYWRLPTVNDD